MTHAFLFFRAMAVGVLLLLSLKVWLNHRRQVTGRLLLALFGSIAAYCVAPFLGAWPWLKYPVVMAAILVPAIFWLVSLAVFQDWERRQISVSRLQIIVVLLFLLTAFGGFLVGGQQPQADNMSHWVLLYLSNLFKIVFMCLSLAAIMAQSRQDLVQARRQLRTTLLAVGGSYILAVICAEMLLGSHPAPLWLEVGHSLLLLLLLTVTAVWILVVSPDDLLGAPRERQQTAPKPLSTSEQNWLHALQNHIENEQGYYRSDLTIRGLGETLSIPEHQLRSLINRHLGFRNFNDYLNHYRIAEAARRLADPEEERLPVLTIALDVGYASLTPFNRAFKAQHLMTPTAYRRQFLSLQQEK